MPAKSDPRAFSAFRITTTTEVILFLRHNSSARSEASIGEAEPYRACVGVSFELGEPAALNWVGGRGFTGGLVLSVEQLPGPLFVPAP